MPERSVESWNTGLLHRLNIGCGPPSGLRHHGMGLDLSAAHKRIGARRHTQGEIDVARGQILVQRGAATIWHELELGAGHVLEISGGNVGRSTNANRSGRGLVRVLLWPGNQFLEVLCWQ